MAAKASTNWLVPAIWTGGLAPLAVMASRFLRGTLGGDPVAMALNQVGLLALALLVLSLACTPLRTLTGAVWPIKIRKALGLLGFTYVAIHFAIYALVDQGADLSAIVRDVTERWFIVIGFTAFVLLIPLAITSTSGMLKSLGAARWRALHRLAYVATALGVVHFVLRVKADLTEPLAWGAGLGLLLMVRVVTWGKSYFTAAAETSVKRS
jgi:sulfoxide reductase heme-binding subunit YedZ